MAISQKEYQFFPCRIPLHLKSSVFRVDIVNRLFFSGMVTIVIIGFFSIVITNSVFGEENREIQLTPIFTRWIDDSFKHVYAVCSSELVEGDIVLVSSDIASNQFKIEKNAKINDCRTFETRIMASDPSTVTIEIIKAEKKQKIIQILETKVNTLENIIERLFSERDELLKEANATENNLSLLEAATHKLSRISDLMNYQERLTKKLNIISSI